MPPTYDHLASRQLGLITRAQLRGLGWTDDHVDHAVRSGRLVGVRRGVFRVAGAEKSVLHPILAATLARPDADLVASDQSAALAWGFKYIEIPAEPILLGERRVRLDGVITRRCSVLPLEDRSAAGVLPVTTPARTICDLATHVHPKALGMCLDDARRRQLVGLHDVQSTYERLHVLAANRPGLKVVALMLADRAGQTSAGGSRSELELWPVLKRTGLDGLAQQHEVWIDGVRYFLDYALPALKIAIEYDPFETHARTSQCG